MPTTTTTAANTYGFTVKTESGKLVSWIIEAASRRNALAMLQCGDRPDAVIILTGRLSEAQRFAWVQAAQDHGGFDEQMAGSILSVY